MTVPRPPATGRRPRIPALARAFAIVAVLAAVAVIGIVGRVSEPAQAATIHQIVGLGDSVPAGTACNCETYISLVGDALAARQHTPVGVNNLALPGQTTQGLTNQIGDPVSVATVSTADLAILTVGANDFDTSLADRDCGPADPLTCYQPELDQLRSRLDGLLTEIRSLVSPPGQILVTGYWNVFLDGQVGKSLGSAYVDRSDALTREVNKVIASVAAAHGATYVDLYTPMKGDGDVDDTALLAADGDHPNAAGHRVIAQAVLATLAATPRPSSSVRPSPTAR